MRGRAGEDPRPLRLLPPHNLGGAGEVADLVAGRLARAGGEVLVVAATPHRADAGRSTAPDAGQPDASQTNVGQSVGGQRVTVQRIWCPGTGLPAPPPEPPQPPRGASSRTHRRPLQSRHHPRPQCPRAALLRLPRRLPRRRGPPGPDGARLPPLLPDQVPLLPGGRGVPGRSRTMPPLPAHPARPGTEPPGAADRRLAGGDDRLHQPGPADGPAGQPPPCPAHRGDPQRDRPRAVQDHRGGEAGVPAGSTAWKGAPSSSSGGASPGPRGATS